MIYQSRRLFNHMGASNFLHPKRVEREAGDTPHRMGIHYQDMWLVTQDGVRLGAWWTPSQNGATILVAHGYPGARSTDLHVLFAKHGYGVISWDARAQGESEGEICTFGYREVFDVEAALEYARGHLGAERVGAFGQSMGGTAVIYAAARRTELEAIVVDSTFAALEEMITIRIPNRLTRWLIRCVAEIRIGVSVRQLRPIEYIDQISPRPIFIIQGAADTAIPSDSAQRLYGAAGEPRRLWIEPDVDHVAMYKTHPDEYEKRVIDFFDQYLGH
jgi:fermentation-respiration switch protein FrsA (DUF1100 family)